MRNGIHIVPAVHVAFPKPDLKVAPPPQSPPSPYAAPRDPPGRTKDALSLPRIIMEVSLENIAVRQGLGSRPGALAFDPGPNMGGAVGPD